MVMENQMVLEILNLLLNMKNNPRWRLSPRIFLCQTLLVDCSYQRLMDMILARLDFCHCYIDDILVFNAIVEEHQENFSVWTIEDVIGVQEANIEAIMHIFYPIDMSRFHVFMDLTNCYQKYVKRISGIVKTLKPIVKTWSRVAMGKNTKESFCWA